MDQVAILNNEEDWRNGMRVKLLKQMVIGFFVLTVFSILGCKRINVAFIYFRASTGRVDREDNPAGALILRRVAVIELLKQGLRRIIM